MSRGKAKKMTAKVSTNKTMGSLTKSLSIFRPYAHIPRLVVFDLDFTLWYPEMYELWGPPFKKNTTTGAVTDCNGQQVHLFQVVHTVLSLIKMDPQFQDTKVAVASRTTEPKWAKTCMRLLDVDIRSKEATQDKENKECNTSLQSIVDYAAIYPRHKRVHFEQLKKDSGIPYEDMLFFDNEYGNVHDIQKLRVTCAYCPQGLTEESWSQGMAAFQAAKRT